MRPLIGITSDFELDTTRDPPRLRAALLAHYTDAVLAAGGLPLPLVPPPEVDEALLDQLLTPLDGIVFTGGDDLDPALYGEPPHSKTRVMHARRNQFEPRLFRRADAAGLPILAICLGFQVAHVTRGGRLLQHVDDRAGALTHHLPGGRSAFHPVRIEPDSRLAAIVGRTEIEVNSRHHQAVEPALSGRGLRPVAWSPDGLLEASEDCRGRFLIAVQWHPENLVDRAEHLALFRALVGQAARREL